MTYAQAKLISNLVRDGHPVFILLPAAADFDSLTSAIESDGGEAGYMAFPGAGTDGEAKGFVVFTDFVPSGWKGKVLRAQPMPPESWQGMQLGSDPIVSPQWQEYLDAVEANTAHLTN